MIAVHTHRAAMLSPATDWRRKSFGFVWDWKKSTCTKVDSPKLLVLFSTKAELLTMLRSSITDVLLSATTGVVAWLVFRAFQNQKTKVITGFNKKGADKCHLWCCLCDLMDYSINYSGGGGAGGGQCRGRCGSGRYGVELGRRGHRRHLQHPSLGFVCHGVRPYVPFSWTQNYISETHSD